MTRLVYDSKSETFGFQDKFLWFWVDKTAVGHNGGDLPCCLVGFSTLTEAIAEAQSNFYIHESCFPFLNEFTFIGTNAKL